jgi:hypothetical protein
MKPAAALKSRAPKAGLVFLISFLGCGAYYLAWQLHHWPELPGFIVLVGGLPWSWLWLSVEHQVVSLDTVNPMQRPTLYVASLAVLAGGFSLNCTLVYLTAAFARNKLQHRVRSNQ